MKIGFEHRPYAGRHPRPTPEVHIEMALNTLIVAIPWGPRTAARKVIDRVLEFLSFASQDKEATSPLPKLSCLSAAANNLRIATLLANDMLYREDNRDEYHVGVELLTIALADNELSWAQVGGPHMLLSRNHAPILSIGSQIDLSLDYSSDDGRRLMTSLPAQLLGLDSSVNVAVNSFRARPEDQLILLAHPRPPPMVYSWKRPDLDLNSMVRTVANEDPNLAFWVGQLSLQAESSDRLVATGGAA